MAKDITTQAEVDRLELIVESAKEAAEQAQKEYAEYKRGHTKDADYETALKTKERKASRLDGIYKDARKKYRKALKAYAKEKGEAETLASLRKFSSETLKEQSVLPSKERSAERKANMPITSEERREIAELKSKKKAYDKEQRRQQRAAEKQKEKQRQEEAHRKRVMQRAANQQEYEDQLAAYKEQHAKERAEYKARQEQLAKDRHDKYLKDLDEKTKAAQDSGKKAYQSINDYTYSAVEAYKQQEESGGYKGSSSQAKKELKDSLKDLWKMGAGDAQDELSQAYKDASGSIDVFRNAKGTVQDLIKNSVGQGKNMLNDANLTYQAAMLNITDKDAMLEIQKQILAQKLADRIIMDQIADNVRNQMDIFMNAGKDIQNALLVQKAYIAAYVKQTFGNPQFMANVTHVVTIKVFNYVDAMKNEQVDKINGKIDKAFERVDKKLDKITEKSYKILDKAAKIDILKDFNNKLDKMTSLEGLQNKLNKNPILGPLLSPLVGAVSQVGNVAVKGFMASTGVTGAVARIQEKIVGLQSKIADAKNFIATRVQMVKDYLNQLKEKAKAAVKQFADKVVADIKAKTTAALTAAFAKKGASF